MGSGRHPDLASSILVEIISANSKVKDAKKAEEVIPGFFIFSSRSRRFKAQSEFSSYLHPQAKAILISTANGTSGMIRFNASSIDPLTIVFTCSSIWPRCLPRSVKLFPIRASIPSSPREMTYGANLKASAPLARTGRQNSEV